MFPPRNCPRCSSFSIHVSQYSSLLPGKVIVAIVFYHNGMRPASEIRHCSPELELNCIVVYCIELKCIEFN